MIKIYSTTTCVYCKHVEKFLSAKGFEYEKIMLDDDPELRQQLLEKTGAMTVPITERDGKYVIGWNLPELNKLLA